MNNERPGFSAADWEEKVGFKARAHKSQKRKINILFPFSSSIYILMQNYKWDLKI